MKLRNSTLPVLAVMTLVAVAGGYQLGEAAVAQIDPLYFEGAAAPARDVTQRVRPGQPNAYAAASGWEEGYAARSVDCGADCPPPLTDGTVTRADVALTPYADPTIAPRWEEASSPAPTDLLVPEGTPEESRVARYMHYPVSADQAEIRTALDGEKPSAEPR
jgi:hypothetical protein